MAILAYHKMPGSCSNKLISHAADFDPRTLRRLFLPKSYAEQCFRVLVNRMALRGFAEQVQAR